MIAFMKSLIYLRRLDSKIVTQDKC